MNIRLGNLSLEEIQKKAGVEFSKEFITIMESKRQEDVSRKIGVDNWHCFHIPFELVVGEDLLPAIKEHLVPIGNKFKEALRVSVQQQ